MKKDRTQKQVEELYRIIEQQTTEINEWKQAAQCYKIAAQASNTAIRVSNSMIDSLTETVKALTEANEGHRNRIEALKRQLRDRGIDAMLGEAQIIPLDTDFSGYSETELQKVAFAVSTPEPIAVKALAELLRRTG